MDVNSPGDVVVPVNRVVDDRPQYKMCDPEVIERVMVECVRANLQSYWPGMDLEDPAAKVTPQTLLATEDRLKDTRPRGYKANPFELCPVYELRYGKSIRFGQRGVVGVLNERGLRNLMSYMFKLEIEAVQSQQPNGDWRLVAALPRQVSTKILRHAPSGPAPAEEGRKAVGSMVQSLLGVTNYDEPPQIPVEKQFGFQEGADLRWEMPVVFCDVARAELVDPNSLISNGLPNKQMEKYAETHQFRYLTQGQRRGRKSCEDAIIEFFGARARILASMPKELEPQPQFSPAQIAAIVDMRRGGVPEATLASAFGCSLEELNKLLAEAAASYAASQK